jgi:hypothetical protein
MYLVLRHVWTTNVNGDNYFRRTALSHPLGSDWGGGAAHLKHQTDRQSAQIFLHKQTGRGIFQQPDTQRAQKFLHKHILALLNRSTDNLRHGSIASVPTSYSGGPRSKFRPRNCLVFFSPSKQMPERYFELRHDRLLPHSLEYFVH